MDKGTVSNTVSAAVLGVAFFLPEAPPRDILLSASLFALSGGITNALAVKMLFDRIPGLYGSGVIPARFREIREEVKRIIIEEFFNEDDLREFFETHGHEIDWMRYVDLDERSGGPVASFVESHWDRFTAPDVVRPVVASQVERLLQSPMGGFLGIVGRGTVEDMVGNFVRSFAYEMKGHVLAAAETFEIDTSALDVRLDVDVLIRDLQEKVGVLLDRKLERLQPDDVKRMMEDVMRQHLGWLVVWGNVFGALLGVAAWFIL